MNVETLQRSDREGAARVLFESFHDYPVMRFFLEPYSGEFDTGLATLVRFFCEARFARGYPVLGVRRDGGIAGAALVSLPGSPRRPMEVQRLFERLQADVGTEVLERMSTYDAIGSQDLPDAPFHYLGMVGVLNSARGMGYGRDLIEAAHELAANDPESVGVCLHTEVEDNVGLYEHLGYRILGIREVAGLRSWCMMWEKGD